MGNLDCGWQRLTSSGAVGTAGDNIVLCGYNIQSGATAAVPYFNQGSALSGSSLVFRGGSPLVSQGNPFDISNPIQFTGGLWISFDANTTAVTVFYRKQP